jgi:hypothetical protein
VTTAPQVEREVGTPSRHSIADAPAAAEGVWPLPARWIDHLTLGSSNLTVAYWGGVALVVAGLFVTRLLPCVDYPQHLALSDIARRLQDPASPEQAAYQLNYFTYNGLFHVIVAWLSMVLPIELAGRLVVAASLVGTAGAVTALVRVLRRPPEYAALFTPILFSFSVGWGFVNYVLATTVAAWALVAVAHAVVRPSIGSLSVVAALGLLCAFAHVLAMLTLCAGGAALAFELAWRVTSPSPGAAWWRSRPVRAFLRGTLVLLPLAIGCAFCIAVYQRQYVWDPNMYRDPTMEGTAPSIWEKVVFFSAFATDLFGDGTDQIVLWVAVGVMAWSTRLFWKARRARAASRASVRPPPPAGSPAIVAPFVVMTLAYFATPMVLIGTHLIFPRLAQWTILGALLATPRFPAALASRARAWIPRLGLVAGLNTVAHCALFSWETADASATIDDLPPGRAATAVIWEPWTAAFRNGTLTHLAAYYAARKHGRWAFAFARYLSVPVRFKPGGQPAWPTVGWEFDGESYDARCKYARAFPLVIIKAPAQLPRDASGEPLVRNLVFKQDAAAVTLLSHHGSFWAFDTTGLPDDGRF